MSVINLLDFVGAAKTPVILQNESSECGLACLVMVAAYHGYKTDLASLQRRNLGVGRGARLSDLMHIAAQLKLGARPVKVGLDDLHRLQTPAILHWDFNHYALLLPLSISIDFLENQKNTCQLNPIKIQSQLFD